MTLKRQGNSLEIIYRLNLLIFPYTSILVLYCIRYGLFEVKNGSSNCCERHISRKSLKAIETKVHGFWSYLTPWIDTFMSRWHDIANRIASGRLNGSNSSLIICEYSINKHTYVIIIWGFDEQIELLFHIERYIISETTYICIHLYFLSP